jgi:hypothetical protein
MAALPVSAVFPGAEPLAAPPPAAGDPLPPPPPPPAQQQPSPPPPLGLAGGWGTALASGAAALSGHAAALASDLGARASEGAATAAGAVHAAAANLHAAAAGASGAVQAAAASAAARAAEGAGTVGGAAHSALGHVSGAELYALLWAAAAPPPDTPAPFSATPATPMARIRAHFEELLGPAPLAPPFPAPADDGDRPSAGAGRLVADVMARGENVLGVLVELARAAEGPRAAFEAARAEAQADAAAVAGLGAELGWPARLAAAWGAFAAALAAEVEALHQEEGVAALTWLQEHAAWGSIKSGLDLKNSVVRVAGHVKALAPLVLAGSMVTEGAAGAAAAAAAAGAGAGAGAGAAAGAGAGAGAAAGAAAAAGAGVAAAAGAGVGAGAGAAAAVGAGGAAALLPAAVSLATGAGVVAASTVALLSLNSQLRGLRLQAAKAGAFKNFFQAEYVLFLAAYQVAGEQSKE